MYSVTSKSVAQTSFEFEPRKSQTQILPLLSFYPAYFRVPRYSTGGAAISLPFTGKVTKAREADTLPCHTDRALGTC